MLFKGQLYIHGPKTELVILTAFNPRADASRVGAAWEAGQRQAGWAKHGRPEGLGLGHISDAR